jgi:hypothetical protein
MASAAAGEKRRKQPATKKAWHVAKNGYGNGGGAISNGLSIMS